MLCMAAVVCIGTKPGRCAEHQASAHHDHAPARGVHSLDVYADGSRLHLLTGESTKGSERPALLHQQSDDAGAAWSQSVRVDAEMPAAFSLHRGMDAQLAAAGDRVIVVWMTAGTDEWGSGPMATALSNDGGKTWRAGPNPADDGSTTGHGFIDIAADRAGIFHLTWLDSRDGKQGLRYARSEDGGESWSANVTAKAATCECCSNAIVTGPNGEVGILFRDSNPRDIRLVRTHNQGKSWLPPVATGGFDWQFNGCPHVGGGLALVAKDGNAVFHTLVWTGKVGHIGIYHVALPNGDEPASAPRQLGNARASHPDLAADAQGRLAAVWDSGAGETSEIWGATSADSGKSWSAPQRLSDSVATATHPRVVATINGFRAFWTEQHAGQPDRWATAVLKPQ
jgi:hypothetical protein